MLLQPNKNPLSIKSKTMTNEYLYWYQGENTSLQNWVKIFAQKELRLGETIFNLKVIGFSHQIEILREGGNSTEILASKIPNEILKSALKIPLTKDSRTHSPKYSIEIQKYNSTVTEDFLDHSNSLSHLFDKDCWTVIIWDINAESINFKTLHTYPDLDLLVITQSKYSL